MAGRISVAVDGSASAGAALDWAVDEASRRRAALRIVHVGAVWEDLQVPIPVEPTYREALQSYAEGVLTEAVERAEKRAPGLETTTALLTGPVVDALRGESVGGEELVLGSRGLGGFTGLLLGSVALRVAGHAEGPVVVVRGGEGRTTYGEVVVGHDGSQNAQAALEYAFEAARLRGARLRAVHSWQIPMFSSYAVLYPGPMDEISEAAEQASERRLAPWRERYPEVAVVESVVCGHPVAELVEASEEADLVVVGSRGLGGFGAAVLGSVSHGVLHRAHCPVAVVRPRH
ncbi:universal stress protein [Rhizohabitans arisaemae]|uniref:universal stress protein n=1 Tax=Rhizohabitans arisaemae TaxID=2720610 RepID=UPI0024B05417|nr:universal stress protein [Rhizohabitans arisaemae]